MNIKDIETITRGTSSTVKADDLIPVYTERVEKFLRDNQLTMGDEWVREVGSNLYSFSGKNDNGDLLGSSIDMGVALATFCPEIPLITGQQLLNLYSQAGNRNPFGDVYIDFGIQINGRPETNSAQAKVLLNDLESREIKIKEGKVIDFAQLRLEPNKDAGLVYRLADSTSENNLADVSAYPFGGRFRKKGLFGGVYLFGGDWCAGDDNLPYSDDFGRVVRYDAEGVATKKSEDANTKPDLAKTLSNEFLKKF